MVDAGKREVVLPIIAWGYLRFESHSFGMVEVRYLIFVRSLVQLRTNEVPATCDRIGRDSFEIVVGVDTKPIPVVKEA